MAPASKKRVRPQPYGTHTAGDAQRMCTLAASGAECTAASLPTGIAWSRAVGRRAGPEARAPESSQGSQTTAVQHGSSRRCITELCTGLASSLGCAVANQPTRIAWNRAVESRAGPDAMTLANRK